MHKSKTQKILQRNKKKNTSRNMIIKWLSTSDNKSLKSILTENKKSMLQKKKIRTEDFPLEILQARIQWSNIS